jgi:endo-1,4-beta-xylanase
VRIEDILVEADLRCTVLRECTSLTLEIALKWDCRRAVAGRLSISANRRFAGLRCPAGPAPARPCPAVAWQRARLGVPGWALAQLRSQRICVPVQRYMEAVVSRYCGMIGQWDVVNEPIEAGYRLDGLRGSVFLEVFGPSYIECALHEARRLVPGAELMINEFALETDSQVESVRRCHS